MPQTAREEHYMSEPLDIHPDFQSIKGRKLTFTRWALAPLQNLLAGVNALHRRKFKEIVTRRTIPGLAGKEVTVQIIRPEQLAAPAAALIYFHGGAFVMKHAPQHLENAVRYAREAHCLVIFVEYRLAPQNPFPAGFDDCYAALRWAIANAGPLGIDTSRIAVGGDSAGGALAAGVAQKALQEDGIALRGQMLIYPVVDLDCTRPSTSAFANVPPFKAASTWAIATCYLGQPVSAGLPRYASPINGDLTRLPPAYVETAQFDLLHDQGDAYARALSETGIDVDRNEIPRAVHGFDLLAAGSAISRAAMDRRIQFLRRVLAR